MAQVNMHDRIHNGTYVEVNNVAEKLLAVAVFTAEGYPIFSDAVRTNPHGGYPRVVIIEGGTCSVEAADSDFSEMGFEEEDLHEVSLADIKALAQLI